VLSRLTVVATLALLACGGDKGPAPAPEMTSARPPAPAETLTVPEHRVWIRAPEPGWELLAEEEAAKVAPGAVAGWRGPDGCVGWVTVQGVDERTREELAAASRDAAGLGDAQVVMDEAFLYGPRTAWRWETSRREGDLNTGNRAIIVVDGDRAWEVRARGQASIHTLVRRCLDAVTASFDLLLEP